MIDKLEDTFIPLEFSVAAFRLGHSMVRSQYEWNYFHCSEEYREGPAELENLFILTKFSGNLDGAPRLKSDWIIDWRRFFDLSDVGYPVDGRLSNRAKAIDTSFDLHLDKIPGYPHHVDKEHQSITVRNLLRGLSFDLPTGEEVAKSLHLSPLEPQRIAKGPHEAILSRDAFCGRTPLWYYLLKEAELNNGQPGRVASCILVETFLGLIDRSPHSILRDPHWRPKYGVENRATQKYKMSNLLAFANVVDPIGEHMGES